MKISIKTIERRMALVSGIGQEFHLREITGMLTLAPRQQENRPFEEAWRWIFFINLPDAAVVHMILDLMKTVGARVAPVARQQASM